MVSEVAASKAWFTVARFLCLERYAYQVQRRTHHLQGLRDVELGLGSGSEGVLLAPLLLASAGFEFRQSRRARCADQGSRFLDGYGSRCVSSRCDSLSLRTGR